MSTPHREPLLRVVSRPEKSPRQILLLRLESVLLSLAAGGVFILIIGYNPFAIYGTILQGAFRSKMAVQATVKYAIPLVIASLGVTLAFKMRFWNIGAEGQTLIGGLAGMLLRPGRVNRWVLALVGFFLATVVYGLVVDLSTVLMTVTDFTWPAVLAVYASGAPFDLVFGGSTAVFLVLFGTPLEQKITRLQRKYGLLERKATAGDKENCHE